MKIAVVGMGVVGTHMAADIERAGHICAQYDIAPRNGKRWATREEVNACDAAFVCVSTPQGKDGACDLSAIDEVFEWLRVPVAIIRSTIPPGTTDRIQYSSPILNGKGDPYCVVFSPEFIGEGVNAPYNAMRQPPFIIIGGDAEARKAAGNVFAKLYNAECAFIYMSAVSAEVAKYTENYFLATKVTLFNEVYDICQAVGADFNDVVAGVTHDYRIGRSHTHVYPDNRGWGGRCLPKDTAALLALVGEDTAPLLAAVRRVNDQHRAQNARDSALEAGVSGAGSPPAGGNGRHV